jgi:hypothetical protein
LNWNTLPPIGLGWLLALLVLLAVVIFAISGHALTRDWILGFIGALAVARLLP